MRVREPEALVSLILIVSFLFTVIIEYLGVSRFYAYLNALFFAVAIFVLSFWTLLFYSRGQSGHYRVYYVVISVIGIVVLVYAMYIVLMMILNV